MEDTLWIAGIVKNSIVDGPGIRYTIFTQGCLHRCPGCHNPETWDLEKGNPAKLENLLNEIANTKLLQGVTFTGGDPFLQAPLLAKLGKAIKKLGLDLLVYTGYTWEELRAKDDPNYQELLAVTDILVDGPFKKEEKDLSLPFRGSRNQRIINVPASLISGEIVLAELL